MSSGIDNAVISLDHMGDTLTVKDAFDNRYEEELVREYTGHISQDLTKFANDTIWKIDPKIGQASKIQSFPHA